MKPLTIEQLKALKEGDWVWIENEKYIRPNKFYASISPRSQSQPSRDRKKWMIFETNTEVYCFKFKDYGTEWLAYKNKEQAECKGEVIEFPCKVRDKAGYVVNRGKLSKIEETYVKHIVIYAWGFEVEFEDTGRHLTFNFDGTIKNSFNIYLDKSEAERRLAELTKECSMDKEREIAKLAEIINNRVGTNLGTKSGFGKSAREKCSQRGQRNIKIKKDEGGTSR